MAGCIPFAAIAHLTDLSVVVTAGICLGAHSREEVIHASFLHTLNAFALLCSTLPVPQPRAERQLCLALAMTLKGDRQGLKGLLQPGQVTSHTAGAQSYMAGRGQRAWIGLSGHHLTSPLHRPAPALFLGPGVKSSAFCPWKPPSRPLFIRRPGPLDHQRGARGPLSAFFLSFFHLLPLLDPLVWSGPSRLFARGHRASLPFSSCLAPQDGLGSSLILAALCCLISFDLPSILAYHPPLHGLPSPSLAPLSVPDEPHSSAV
ncbi:hypothetical protein GGI35DRAFT_393824 [Trichoderma velutinum]